MAQVGSDVVWMYIRWYKCICNLNNCPNEKGLSLDNVNRSVENSTQHNLQISSSLDLNTYAIPSIINGRLSRVDSNQLETLKTPLLKEVKPNPSKMTERSIHSKHKICIIGDSHVKGLSDKLSNDLDECFSVIGISKPNANTEGIISSLNLLTENFTKNDLVIFYGGNTDISKNESKKGFYSLKTFLQRMINTNVILLGVPHRYDLPSFSCVNSEVYLFNKRLYSLQFFYKHVRYFNFPTDRSQHTNHGLHLNMKGKSWIANHLVRVIKDLFLPYRAPILSALPWRNDSFNSFQILTQNKVSMNDISSVTNNVDYENLLVEITDNCVHDTTLVSSTDCFNSGITALCDEHGNSVTSDVSLCETVLDCVENASKGRVELQKVDYEKQIDQIYDTQENSTIRKSTRLKKLPSSRNCDFLW